MASWAKGGADGDEDDVKSGPGSKKGSSSQAPSKAGSNEKSHDVEFAEGGHKNHMFGEQEADDAQPGFTEKKDSKGPGEKFASGGSTKMFGFEGSKPATAGITSAR